MTPGRRQYGIELGDGVVAERREVPALLDQPIGGEYPGAAAIVSNGGGAGVLATDRLIEQGGHLATLGDDTIAKLNAVLPPTWSHANPIDIIGDADAERYGNAVSALMQDDNVDGLLVMYCPTAISTAAETAQGLIDVLARPALAVSYKHLTLPTN